MISAPHAFMTRFEMILASLDVPQSVWYRFLPLVCNQLHADWISHNLASPASVPSSVPSWSEIKAGFFKHFDNPHQAQINLSKLFNARLLKDESVRDFSSRFQHLLRLAHKDDSDPDFLQLFLSRLPLKIQHSVQSEIYLSERHGLPIQSITQIIESAIAHDSLSSALHDNDKPASSNKQQSNPSSSSSNKCPLHPENSHSASDCRALQNKLSDPSADCPVHPHANHKAVDCHQLKRSVSRKSASQSMDRPSKDAKSLADVTCFKCGHKGHYANNCPTSVPPSGAQRGTQFRNPRALAASANPQGSMGLLSQAHPSPASHLNSNSSANSASLNQADPDLSQLLGLNDMSAAVAETSPLASKGIRIPMTIHDRVCNAVLDTGATVSFLSPQFVKLYNLAFNRVSGAIGLANSTSAPRIGTTAQLPVTLGPNTFKHSFEIMDVPHGLDALIGLDLYDKLGFQIQFDPSLAYPLHAPSSDPDSKPRTALPDPAFDSQREDMLQELQPEFALNASIPIGSFCSHPSAVVR